MSAGYLSIDNVSMRFGGLQALDAVSFEVEQGSVVGLIGPNGSGKTTLMNLVSGVMKPSGGAVTFKGVRIASVAAYRVSQLGIGRTFQVVRPFANLDVLENVAVGAMYAREGAKRSTRDAFAYGAELLEFVGLDRVAGKPASDLTIPDRKRLELAKALALDPEVLLLDEVMAGLTLTEIDEAVELLRRINERGVTLIVVEHVMKAIMAISNTVVVLAEGVKIAEGPPEAVTEQPEVIQAYLGSRYVARRQELRDREAARTGPAPEAPEPSEEPHSPPGVDAVVEGVKLFRRSGERVVEMAAGALAAPEEAPAPRPVAPPMAIGTVPIVEAPLEPEPLPPEPAPLPETVAAEPEQPLAPPAEEIAVSELPAVASRLPARPAEPIEIDLRDFEPEEEREPELKIVEPLAPSRPLGAAAATPIEVEPDPRVAAEPEPLEDEFEAADATEHDEAEASAPEVERGFRVADPPRPTRPIRTPGPAVPPAAPPPPPPRKEPVSEAEQALELWASAMKESTSGRTVASTPEPPAAPEPAVAPPPEPVEAAAPVVEEPEPEPEAVEPEPEPEPVAEAAEPPAPAAVRRRGVEAPAADGAPTEPAPEPPPAPPRRRIIIEPIKPIQPENPKKRRRL